MVVTKLVTLGLNKVYPWLFLYIAVDAFESLLGVTLSTKSNLYFDVYFVGQTSKLVIGVGLVLELFRQALTDHPALARFGRRAAGYLLLAAASAATAALALNSHIPHGRSPLLYRYILFERTMAGTLAVFLVLITAFASWFPVRMRRNVVLYIYGFLGYFVARFLGLLALAVLPLRWKNAEDSTLLLLQVACLVVWIIGLNREGEQKTTVIGQRWNPAESERLALQLNAINANLVRFVK